MRVWICLGVVACCAVNVRAQVLLGDLVRPDGDVNEQYGWSVDLDGDRAAVSARRDGEAGQQAGAVYILSNPIQTLWLPEDKILPDEPTQPFNFGYSVALSGETLMVGSPFSDESVFDGGAVYVHDRQADGEWTRSQSLTSTPSAVDAGFGWCVELSGDLAVVGAPFENDSDGAVYIFERGGGGLWAQTQRLTSPDGRTDSEFGSSLSLEDGTLVVGARGDDEQILNGGSAYVFSNAARGQWAFETKLLPQRTVSRGAFGHDVGLRGGVIAVARPVFAAVLVFERDGGGQWNETAELELGQLDERGAVEVTDQGNVLAGVPSGSGAIAIFSKAPSGEWYECGRIDPDRLGEQTSEFGTAFDAEGTRVVGGNPYYGTSAGRAWIFDTLAYDYFEDFESFTAGPLVDEFGWDPYAGLTKQGQPNVQVVDSGIPGFGNRSIRHQNINTSGSGRAIRGPDFGCLPDSISVDVHITAGTSEHSILYEDRNGNTNAQLYFEVGGAITTLQEGSSRGVVSRVPTDGAWSPGVTTRIEMVNRNDASLSFFQDGELVFEGRDLNPMPVSDPPSLFRRRASRIETLHQRSNSEFFYLDNLQIIMQKPIPSPADLDGDGEVASGDLGILLAAWGSSDSEADLDGDGAVGSGDLGILLASWGM